MRTVVRSYKEGVCVKDFVLRPNINIDMHQTGVQMFINNTQLK